MKVECQKCHRVRDLHISEWSWVRYKNSFRDRLICPDCLKDAQEKKAVIVSDMSS